MTYIWQKMRYYCGGGNFGAILAKKHLHFFNRQKQKQQSTAVGRTAAQRGRHERRTTTWLILLHPLIRFSSKATVVSYLLCMNTGTAV